MSNKDKQANEENDLNDMDLNNINEHDLNPMHMIECLIGLNEKGQIVLYNKENESEKNGKE